MVVCKFWLENRCRYGTTCRFEHSKAGSQDNLLGSNENWQGGSQRVTFQNNFGSSSNQYKWSANQGQGHEGNSSSALDVVNSLPEEMKRWEESKMWPFSCVSIEKDLPSLPDFQDLSVEEMRLDAYQCKAQGSMEPYIKKYQALTLEFQNKRRQLQHMTMDLKQKLIKFVEEGRRKKTMQSTTSRSGLSSHSSTGHGLFGSTPQTSGSSSASLFGGSASAQSSVFGGNSGSTSTANPVFSNNKFGVLASGSTFGGSASSSAGGSLFGNPAASSSTNGSLFGKPAASGSGLFGASNQNNDQQKSLLGPGPSASSGLFGGQGSQPTPGLFSSGTGSGQSPAPNVFGYSAGIGGSNTGQPAPNLFGSRSSSNPVPNSQPAPNLFGSGLNSSSGNNSLFGKQASSTTTGQTSLLGPIPTNEPPSLFGKGNNPSVAGESEGHSAPQGAPNLFGKPNPGFASVSATQGQTGRSSTAPDLFGKSGSQAGGENTHANSSTMFTPLSDLTEFEKAAFEAKEFQLGKIPLRPPPKELLNV